jgi:hypothetical protein
MNEGGEVLPLIEIGGVQSVREKDLIKGTSSLNVKRGTNLCWDLEGYYDITL